MVGSVAEQYAQASNMPRVAERGYRSATVGTSTIAEEPPHPTPPIPLFASTKTPRVCGAFLVAASIRVTGFEPATSCSQSRCSTKLSYTLKT